MTTITSADNPRFRDLAKILQSGRERRKSALQAQERKIEVALSNSFGFGGTNASIVFKAAP